MTSWVGILCASSPERCTCRAGGHDGLHFRRTNFVELVVYAHVHSEVQLDFVRQLAWGVHSQDQSVKVGTLGCIHVRHCAI